MGFGQWLGTADEAVLVPAWHNITTANFSRNQITYIDESVVRCESPVVIYLATQLSIVHCHNAYM